MAFSNNDDDVILNIYELNPDPNDVQQGSETLGFFSRLLKPIGFGAYHTSITVKGFCYTFGAGAGICKSRSTNDFVPQDGMFQKSIILGRTVLRTQGEINEMINQLRQDNMFTGTSYHLINRNCNHFSETFALTLMFDVDQLADETNPPQLKLFPNYVNRLAKTGTMVINHGNVCHTLLDARKAVGADKKLISKKGNNKTATKDRNKKKELTDKQKEILARIKKGNK